MRFAAELQMPKDPGMFMGLFWSACVHAFTHAEAHPLPTFNNDSTHTQKLGSVGITKTAEGHSSVH